MTRVPFLRLGLPLLLALPAAAAAQTRVGVIVVGPDSAAVGAAQKTLEAGLAGPAVTIRGAADFAAVLGGPTATTAAAWSNDSVARAAFDAAIADAKKSYFSDLMPQAAAKLDEAGAILDKAVEVPGSTRVRVSLWRAAVALRQNQKEAAIGEVNVALLLVPNLEPEPNSPPPVVQLLAELRTKSPKPFKVQLNGVPPNALVKVDDVVFAAGSIAVLPGSHVLDVIAAGFRPFNTTFDAAADSTVEVVLVQSIGPAWEKLFDAIVSRGDVAENEKKSVESLALREKLDVLVIAAVKPEEIRGAVWRRADGQVRTFAARDAAAIASWAAAQLVKPAAVVATTPRPTPIAVVTATPAATPVATPGPGGSGRSVAAEAGLVFAHWNRTLSPEGTGEGYTVPGLTGGGPRVRVQGRRGNGVGELELVHVAFGTMKTTAPDLEPVKVPGGSMTSFRAGAGYRRLFGARDERAPAVVGLIGGFYESHSAKDLSGAEGVFPSHVRAGLELRLATTFSAGPLSFLVGGSLAPFSTWKEDPAGATGDDPKPVAGALRVGAELPVGGNGRMAFDFSRELRKVTFTGVGDSILAPEKATRVEVLALVGLSFRYRF